MTQLGLRTWSTHEYGGGLDLGVVELAGDVLDMIFRRHALLKRLLRKEAALRTVSFLDEACRYIEADVDELVASIGQEHVFADQGWAICSEGVWLPELKFQRIETARMELDVTSVWWSCCPRHGDVDVVTERVAMVKLRELYAGKSSHARDRSARSRSA